MLEKIPARLKVIRHVRPKFSCRACETISQAPSPDLPIEKGRPGPGLLAHVVVSKYLDGLPLYRIPPVAGPFWDFGIWVRILASYLVGVESVHNRDNGHKFAGEAPA